MTEDSKKELNLLWSKVVKAEEEKNHAKAEELRVKYGKEYRRIKMQLRDKYVGKD